MYRTSRVFFKGSFVVKKNSFRLHGILLYVSGEPALKCIYNEKGNQDLIVRYL